MGGLPRKTRYGWEDKHSLTYSEEGLELAIRDLIDDVLGPDATETDALEAIDQEHGHLHGTIFQAELRSLLWFRSFSVSRQSQKEF
jgi:hypothetical protein